MELTYDQKCKCSSDKFCSFVTNNDTFSLHDKYRLQGIILNGNLSGVLYVSTVLAGWSMIAGWVDAAILPAIIVYTIALPGAQYYPLIVPVVFTIVNAILKFVYIRSSLRGLISLKENLLAVVPYVGGAILLRSWFIGDPLLRGAVLAFINHQKKLIIRRVLSFLKGKPLV